MNKKEVIHMQGVTNALLNMVLISLPEEIFVTCMTLILFKRFDLLDIRMWRINIKWIIIPSLLMAMCISIFKYIIILPKLLTSIISLIIFWLAIIYIIRITEITQENKLIFKTIVYSMITLIIVSLIELAYMPLTFSLLKIPYEYFNQNISYMFLLVIPSRILEFSIIIFFIVKMNEQVNIKLYNLVFKNKPLTNMIIFIISFLTLFTIYVVKLIGYNNILSTLPIWEQILSIGFILSLPTIFLMVLWYMINCVVGIEKRIQQTQENLID